MNNTFSPKSCAPDQWKNWLRDAARLTLRSLLGWGILCALIYIGFGFAIKQSSLLIIPVAALSGALQMSHQVVMSRMMKGQVGLWGTCRDFAIFARENLKLLLENIAIRGGVVIGGLAFLVMFMMMGIGLTHMLEIPTSSASTAAVAAPSNMWSHLVDACGAIYNPIVMPILIQFGGSVSVVLNLRRDGLDMKSSRQLDQLAAYRNRESVLHLSWAFLAAAMLCIAMPLLIPLLVIYWMAVMECFYADVFKGGYAIKALATARVPAHQKPAIAFASPL